MSRIDDSAKAREIANALGLPFVLRPNWSIAFYSITESTVTVTINFVETQETVRETRYVRAGLRLMSWTAASVTDPHTILGNTGIAWKYQSVACMDPDFKPYVEHKIGRIESPAEYAERRRWEGEQYRVGSHKSPMDSAGRVCDGPSPMADYWNK